MWRLIGIVIVLLIYLIFIILNQDTRGVVSLGFVKFEGVHTYIITFFAFGAGVIIAEIFSIIARFKRRKKRKIKNAKMSAGAAGAETPSIAAPETDGDIGKKE
ncbi:MAG: hypothetical protein LBH85_09200 [Treponema sp.]|jgi:uncharacterized membrane protein YciS (DUF1049 family)|nr:hypothetical protein [Treponema sp.]